MARLRRAQREDEDLKGNLDKAKHGLLDGYTMQGRLLHKNVSDEIRLVVPRSMHQQLIRKAHERGHFAVDKTEALEKGLLDVRIAAENRENCA